jgi:hypothetical protein
MVSNSKGRYASRGDSFLYWAVLRLRLCVSRQENMIQMARALPRLWRSNESQNAESVSEATEPKPYLSFKFGHLRMVLRLHSQICKPGESSAVRRLRTGVARSRHAICQLTRISILLQLGTLSESGFRRLAWHDAPYRFSTGCAPVLSSQQIRRLTEMRFAPVQQFSGASVGRFDRSPIRGAFWLACRAAPLRDATWPGVFPRPCLVV